MLFFEPQPTRFDLHFRLFDVPVRVDPWFWLVALFGSGANTPPLYVLMWVGVVFVSILVHEFGHVVAFRRYQVRSHVVLYGFGGLAVPAYRGRLDPRADMVVSFGGPLAGFLFAAVLVLGLRLSGIATQFAFGFPEIVDWRFSDMPNGKLAFLFDNLLFVNIFWGLVNLLPIYPLDGGRIARSAFELSDVPDSLRKSLILSMVAAIAMAIYGFRFSSTIYVFLFGYMAYQNYQELQSLGGYGRRW